MLNKMSVWTSNYAIMRDLSKAQGRLVPVDVNSLGVAVAANEKPPQLLATEETEEEFYDTCASGDFDYSATPDFSLIQHMLDMVKRERDGKESLDNSDGDMIQISKVNGHETTKLDTTEKTPKVADIKVINALKKPEGTEAKILTVEVNPESGDAPIKKKKQRNVAITSLLEKEINNNEPIKLLKPTDFMPSKAMIESVRKVDEWFTNEKTSNQKKLPSLASVAMFKKKSSKCLSEKSETQSDKENDASISSKKNTGMFRPSPNADVYYQQYLEKSKLQSGIREDIWQKAERLMIEADAKKAALAAKSVDDDVSSLEMWILSDPRHESHENDDCVVCSTVKKHGYEIDKGTPINK